MKEEKQILPPRWATRFLRWYCRRELVEDLEGDLNEYFDRHIRQYGSRKAKILYCIDVIKFCRRYTVRKLHPHHAMNSFIVFQSYFKTSARNIGRNKLFSVINISGLAIAMAVALPLIALLLELRSFDQFHKDADRIYRVINTLHDAQGASYRHAAASVAAGKKIRETVTGLESITLVARGFGRDVTVGDKTVTLSGLWADESFFRVFSFPLFEGNPATALRDLHSVVLTETSARRLFHTPDAAGKHVQIDNIDYVVTAVLKDLPMNTHLRFDMLGSFVTRETQALADREAAWMKWDNLAQTYVYIKLNADANAETISRDLETLSAEGSKSLQSGSVTLHLQPLHKIMFSDDLSNELGLTVNHTFILTLVWLAVIVIVSACFNYTNLSIARALRRAREVGIRKVTGATRGQVFGQFLFESTLIAMIAVTMAFVIFLLIRPEFLSMNQAFQQLATLTPTPTMLLSFVGLALVIGIMAGVLPAAFFSKMSTAQVLKDVSSIKLFRHLPLRKALIVLQYTLSILFIVVVSLGYRQYRYWLSLDMGFNTENVLTVDLLGNNPAPLLNAFAQLPAVKQLSASSYVSSAGMSYKGMMKYHDLQDSVPLHYNFVNEGYLALYGHTLLAGTDFTSSLPDQSNLIINEHALHWMKLTDPREAIGETIILDGKKFRVIGVVKDFQHNRPNQVIQNFAFRNDPSRYGVISLRMQTSDIRSAMAQLNDAWRTIDRIHPLPATFHDERIRAAFEDLSWMIRMIGAIAFLSIGIAMLGLLGMVIFASETRVKEISIRKVMGASERYLVLLMSRGFLLLLLIASALAIPAGYFFCDQVIFSRSVHHAPFSALDLFGGSALVVLIAMLMIGSQTWKVARSNPARVLKNE